jgi:hypothetical protein
MKVQRKKPIRLGSFQARLKFDRSIERRDCVFQAPDELQGASAIAMEGRAIRAKRNCGLIGADGLVIPGGVDENVAAGVMRLRRSGRKRNCAVGSRKRFIGFAQAEQDHRQVDQCFELSGVSRKDLPAHRFGVGEVASVHIRVNALD